MSDNKSLDREEKVRLAAERKKAAEERRRRAELNKAKNAVLARMKKLEPEEVLEMERVYTTMASLQLDDMLAIEAERQRLVTEAEKLRAEAARVDAERKAVAEEFERLRAHKRAEEARAMAIATAKTTIEDRRRRLSNLAGGNAR